MVAIELREKRPGPIGANENACTIDASIGLELLSLLTAPPQWNRHYQGWCGRRWIENLIWNGC